METPRILAIDDVHLPAPGCPAGKILQFYGDFLGLEATDSPHNGDALAFRGFPRSGPRLIVLIRDDICREGYRQRLLVQVASLYECADLLTEQGLEFYWSSGFLPYGRRLHTQDPAGNWVELVAYHVL